MDQHTVPPLPFKNRKTGLTVFGILTLLGGLLCAMFVPLILVAQTVAYKSTSPQGAQSMIPAMMVYAILAVLLTTLGIGSIMAKRWARALILVLSWSAVLIGVFSIGISAFTLPHTLDAVRQSQAATQPEMQGTVATLVVVITLGIMAVILVGLPAGWIFFYGRSDVKATCEALNPAEAWTDRSPLPVLGASLWLAFGTLFILLMPIAYHSVLPFFGTFISGATGTVACLVTAALWAYSAWAIYKLDQRGLWLAFACILLFAISGFLTYWTHDMAEAYKLMGYPDQQIEQLQKFGIWTGHKMAWVMLGSTVPWLGYLLYIRKFFTRAGQEK